MGYRDIKILLIRSLFLFTCLLCAISVTGQKPRLLVTTDIGGDPDDRQSLIRLMLYACDFEIEGLISSAAGTPGELGESIIRPDLIEEVIQAYATVQPMLIKHDPDYPGPGELFPLIKKGNPERGWENVGEGHDTEASEWIIKCADKEDVRILNISIWGGQTDVAQALWKVKNTRKAEAYSHFISKLRIYDIADQDGIFNKIIENFPGLFYVLNKAPEGEDRRNATFRGMYLGGDESLTSMQWFREHVLEGHGKLGALYPVKTWTDPNPHGLMKEGDTPSWFFFLDNGLNDPSNPGYGGWGGRFTKNNEGYFTGSNDKFGDDFNQRTTVYRWRDDFQREFAARMDWCVKDYFDANHAPVVAVNRHVQNDPLVILKRPGRKIRLNASGSSDPDKDELDFEWMVYPEAGSYDDEPELTAHGPKADVRIPEMKQGSELHVILRVTDSGEPRLTAYKRIIIIKR